jgi:hypothetical protein
MKNMNPTWIQWLRACAKGGTQANIPKHALAARVLRRRR